MTSEDKLTPTEAKVLFELVSRQRDTDKSIAERLGMAPSNFAVIKKRLQERGVLLEEVRVNMHRVKDANITSLVWIEYNQPIREELKAEFEKTRRLFPIAYTYASSDWSLNVDYFRSFEEAENARLALAEILQQKASPYIANYMWKILPVAHLTTCNFESRLIQYSISHQVKPVSLIGGGGECEMSGEEAVELSQTEKKTLIALRKYPGEKRSVIAKRVGIQQSSLSEVFRQLQNKGVINYTRVANPARLPGRDIATFAWIDLRQPMLGETMTERIQEIADRVPQVYKFHYTRTFLFMMGFYHSLDKAENSHLLLLEMFGDNVKTFNFKIVPSKQLVDIRTAYFLEKLFGITV